MARIVRVMLNTGDGPQVVTAFAGEIEAPIADGHGACLQVAPTLTVAASAFLYAEYDDDGED